MPHLPGLADVVDAHVRLKPVLDPTVIQRSRTLSARVGHEVFLKPENLQRTGSFKFRGAYNAVSTLPPEARERGVIAYSSGNHGQAVACAAQLHGIPATIVMPENAIQSKVDAVLAYGGKVIHAGTTSIDRQIVAEAIARDEGLAIIPPFDHPAVVCGQGTAGIEIIEALPQCDTVLVPVGGGGLLSGVALAVRSLSPRTRVIGVEPQGADDAYQSMLKGEIVTKTPDTIADGLRTSHIGELPFAIMQQHVDRIVTVSEGAIYEAMRFLLLRCKLVVEPSGAVPIAALLSGAFTPNGRTVALLSGGNVAPERLAEALGEA